MSDKKLRLEILEKMATLATAGLGLVAALAWNSAIQDLFGKINFFGETDSLPAKLIYAALITVIVVACAYYLGRAINRIKKELGLEDDEEAKR